ncbi:MAG: GGDEF domain-containing protein [Burkholderiales bacterium]|nr:GGDEF domain-containing protein [Burkholderiales bacterium]
MLEQPTLTLPVVSKTSSPSIALQQLQLDNACALLDHSMLVALPAPNESPANYLQGLIDGLCELSLKDPLTGLGNRRHFLSVLERTIDGVARSGDPSLLLMVDVDHFKRVNDTHGHQAGDMVLRAIGKAMAGCVRPMDSVARYGGEEFAVVLPNCHTSYGATVAERIRATIEALVIPISPSLSIQVTASVGGAYAPEWVRSTAALWTERADLQLYRAKSEGRNRVCLDQQQEIYVSAEEKNLLFGHLALGEPAWIESVAGEVPGAAALGGAQRVN